jgi:prepilin-type processing-associated H-X9-DG protein
MRFRALVAFAVLATVPGLTPALPGQASSPEATVRAFLAALEQGNTKEAASYFEGMEEGANEQLQRPLEAGLLTYVVKAARVYGDEKESVVVIDVEANYEGVPHVVTDMFRLRKVGDAWKIQSSSLDSPVPAPSLVATLLIGKPITERAKRADKKTSCLTNIKNLALGTIMYSADNDDLLPNASKWRDSIFPYVKSQDMFRCPEDKSGALSSYRFNPKLSRVSQTAIEDPVATMMIYEGDGEGFIPRHAGKGSVAYVDGHCKHLTATEYAKLRKR